MGFINKILMVFKKVAPKEAYDLNLLVRPAAKTQYRIMPRLHNNLVVLNLQFVYEPDQTWRYVPENDFGVFSGPLWQHDCKTDLEWNGGYLGGVFATNQDLKRFVMRYPFIELYFDEIRKKRKEYLSKKAWETSEENLRPRPI